VRPKFLEFIGNARQRKSDKFRYQLSIFIVCLVISIFLWTLVRLSKDYYYTINYHLKYIQVPGNFRLIKSSDSILTVKIRVQGFDFFSEEFLFRKPRHLDISLKNIKVKFRDFQYFGIMLTESIGKEIASETNFTNDVYSIHPDTLFFEFERHFPKPRKID